ncbi:MAG: hypothetical protein JO092_04570 [Candidatus Eremiobacteraeota bacterium]|nr:hypothetical protein [Candidatus Eremiobacteraeota bacterium]
MSLELVNTFATFGTFLVIAATAIAALVQLRHARSSNQIAALNELREANASAQIQAARHFVRTELRERLTDPTFRHQMLNRRAMSAENQVAWNYILLVGNFYEGMGALVKSGLADRDLVLDSYYGQALSMWELCAPITAILRRQEGIGLWENFEYLTVLSQDWEAAHPQGTYPPGTRRIGLEDEWLEADKRYAASLAPA